MDKEEILEFVPDSHKSAVTDELVDMINSYLEEDYSLADGFKDSFRTHIIALKHGRFKLRNYFEAIRYVTFKTMGYNQTESWCKTFPEKIKELKDRGVKDFTPHASMYDKSKLVVQITQQMIIPSYILNGHIVQEAIDTLSDVMRHTKSDKVRVDACKVLLDTLKLPETSKLSIDIEVKSESIVSSMHKAIEAMATSQLDLLNSGNMTAKELVEANIIDAEVLE